MTRTTLLSTLISGLFLLACDDKKLPLGATCGESWECESGLCESNICIDPVNARCEDGLTRIDGKCVEVETCANSKPCSERGTCVEGDAGLTCSCEEGWSGEACDVCASGQPLCGKSCCASDEICIANACVGDVCAARGGDADGDGVCADADPCPNDMLDSCASRTSGPFVVYERFMSADNPPDAMTGPDFEALIDAENARASVVTYHTFWPGTSEVMNSYNPTDVAAREAYYVVPAIPQLQLGRPIKLHIAELTPELIGSHFDGTPEAFQYDLQAIIDGNVLHVTGNVVASAAQNETDHVLHIVVVEDPVEFAEPPGRNGLNRFRDVMRKMLPSPEGLPLGNGAERVSVDQTWNIVAPADPARITVIAFVQAATSGNVHKGIRVTPGRISVTPR